VNQRAAALERETLKKSRGRFGTPSTVVHIILFHTTGEQPTAVAAGKIEKDT
jgi:hypothetical protein